MAASPPGASLACPQCAIALPLDASFCLRCGAKIPRAASAPAKVAATASARHAQTLLGVVMTPPGAAPTQSAPTQSAPTQSAPTQSAPESIAEPPSPKRVPNAHATMVGVVSPTASSNPAPTNFAAVAASPVSAPLPPQGGTMIGVAPEVAAVSAAMPPGRSGTMIGVAAPTPATGRHRRDVILAEEPGSARASVPPPEPARPSHPRAAPTWDEEFPIQRKAPSRAWAGVLALVAMVGVGVGAAVWYRSRPSEPATLPAALRTLDDGSQVVSLTVAGALAGTRVRYAGVERPVDDAGRAELPIALPADRVGEVELPIEVLAPGGAVERRSVRLVVAWSATTDLTKLSDPRPRIHVIFHVVPGASLWVADTPIRVSGDTGIAEIPVSATAAREGDGVFRSRIAVRVALPAGGTSEGRYEIVAPRLALRVSQPPVSLTREATLVVNGTAPRAVRVVVMGRPATVTGDTWSVAVPLGAGSNSLEIEAFGAGAPSSARVVAYRDVTAEQYLGMNGGDRGISGLIARPVIDGTRVRVSGTLVGQAIETPEGRSIQFVVENRQCPGNRCTAWVDLARDATVTGGSTVEVVGELRGTRSYSLTTGERRTDPVIIGVAVTPRRR